MLMAIFFAVAALQRPKGFDNRVPRFVWHTGLGGGGLSVSPFQIAVERDVHPSEAVEMLGAQLLLRTCMGTAF